MTRRSPPTAADALRFFKLVDPQVDTDIDLQVVLDNLSAQKASAVRDLLAHPRRAAATCTAHPLFVVAQLDRALVQRANRTSVAPMGLHVGAATDRCD